MINSICINYVSINTSNIENCTIVKVFLFYILSIVKFSCIFFDSLVALYILIELILTAEPKLMIETGLLEP